MTRMTIEIQRQGPGHEPVAETYEKHSYEITDSGVLRIFDTEREAPSPVAIYSPIGWLRLVEYAPESPSEVQKSIEDWFSD